MFIVYFNHLYKLHFRVPLLLFVDIIIINIGKTQWHKGRFQVQVLLLWTAFRINTPATTTISCLHYN